MSTCVLGSSLPPPSGLGVEHNSRLTIPDADAIAPGLHVGERISYAGVTRHSDWQQFSLLELMKYNGHFKLVILPGDTRNSAVAQRFFEFSEMLVQNMRGKVVRSLEIFTVFNTPKEVPLQNLRIPEILYAAD